MLQATPRVLALTIALVGALLPSSLLSAQPVSAARDRLVQINDQVRALRQPRMVNGVPDYAASAIASWRLALGDVRARYESIDRRSWAVPDQIDHILVGAQLNAIEFDLRVVRPWVRDPGHWLDMVAHIPLSPAPLPREGRERLVAQLRAVPALLAEAQSRLAAPSADLTDLALRQLTQSDGVNQGEPRRTPPPAGLIGWYEDFLARARQSDRALVPAIESALQALRAYRDWLTVAQPNMRAPAAIGLTEYTWYVRNVLLIPYSADDIRLLGERELAHARTQYTIERHRNRALPELTPVATAAEHEVRTRAAEQLIRDFTQRGGWMTIPDNTPAQFETDAYFVDRSAWGGKRHFWEEIGYRDPINNHIHASIPGHRFDAAIQRRNARPIRRVYNDPTRAEGWAFYLESMFLQAGLLDERPRTRELFYIAQHKRAARIHAELTMQADSMSLQQGVAYLTSEIPLMEENLARYDLAVYLRRPAYGMTYTVGKAQLEKLLADRSRQLGADFDLGAFHDAVLSAGMIPLSLIRWELTGFDDEVRALGLK